MSRLTTAIQVLVLALLAACSNKDPDKAPALAQPHKDEPKEHEPIPNRIRLQSSVLAAAKIRTEKVISKALPMTLAGAETSAAQAHAR